MLILLLTKSQSSKVQEVLSGRLPHCWPPVFKSLPWLPFWLHCILCLLTKLQIHFSGSGYTFFFVQTIKNKPPPKTRAEALDSPGKRESLPFFLSLFSNTCADWQSGRCLHIHECLPRNCSLLQLYGFQENYIVSNGSVKWFNCSSIWQLHSVFILWGNKCFLLAGFAQHI